MKRLTTEFGALVLEIIRTFRLQARAALLRCRTSGSLEKVVRFDREVIPERHMHATSLGAEGNLYLRHRMLHLRQDFSEIGKQTPMLSPTSVADPERDIRGFAPKFCTEEVTGTRWHQQAVTVPSRRTH